MQVRRSWAQALGWGVLGSVLVGAPATQATVALGAASSTNPTSVAPTAGTPGSVSIDANPDVTVSAKRFTVKYKVTR